MDDGLIGVTKLVDLANTRSQIPTERITLATMPVATDPYNKNWAVSGSGGTVLFKTVVNDQSRTADSSAEASVSASAGSTGGVSAAPRRPRRRT